MERTIGERLVVVETQLARDLADGRRREAKQDEILEELTAIRQSMSIVAQDLAKYRSWFGGAVFIISAIATFFYMFGTAIFSMFARLKTGG